jgi:hypothetical protein
VIHTASESKVSDRATDDDWVSTRRAGKLSPPAAKSPSACSRGAVPASGMRTR